MSDKKKPITEGYQPLKKGYQPEQTTTDTAGPTIKGGYQPPSSEGDNPINKPVPPKEE